MRPRPTAILRDARLVCTIRDGRAGARPARVCARFGMQTPFSAWPASQAGFCLTNARATACGASAGANPSDSRAPARFLRLQVVGLFLRCHRGSRGTLRLFRFVVQRLRHQRGGLRHQHAGRA